MTSDESRETKTEADPADGEPDLLPDEDENADDEPDVQAHAGWGTA
jgi:hypothetical protein